MAIASLHAAELPRLSGQDVQYRPAEASVFLAQLTGRGVPEVAAGRVAGFMTDMRNGQEDEVSPDLERLLGRAPTPLSGDLKTLFRL